MSFFFFFKYCKCSHKTVPHSTSEALHNNYNIHVCAPPTYVRPQDFRFKQPPWQRKRKQCSSLPNTCLAPAAKGDKSSRKVRKKRATKTTNACYLWAINSDGAAFTFWPDILYVLRHCRPGIKLHLLIHSDLEPRATAEAWEKEAWCYLGVDTWAGVSLKLIFAAPWLEIRGSEYATHSLWLSLTAQMIQI